MKTIIVYSMFILVFCGNKTFSQIGTGNRKANFGFFTGISHSQVKERGLNDLVHSGPGFNLALVYSRICCNYVQIAELQTSLNFLKSDFEPETDSYLFQFSFRYSISDQLKRCNGRLKMFLGGEVRALATQGIYTNWDVNHFYWLTSYSLGLVGRTQYEISNNRAVSVSFGLPVISLISRTPDKLLIHEANSDFLYVVNQIHHNLSLESPLHHFNPEFKLAYQRNVGNKTIRTIFWQLGYVDNNVNGSSEVKMVNLAFGLEYLFYEY